MRLPALLLLVLAGPAPTQSGADHLAAPAETPRAQSPMSDPQMSPAALQWIWTRAARLGIARDGWERVRVDGNAAVLQRPGRAVHLDVPALSAYGVEPGWYDAQPPTD